MLILKVQCSRKTVTELQEEAQSWTGKYSNSWQIEAQDNIKQRKW